MSKKKVILTAVAVVAGLALGAFLYVNFIGHAARFDAQLVDVSDRLNKTLPIMLDTETRLDVTIPSAGKQLTLVNTLVNQEKAELDTNVLRKVLTPKIVANYRTHPDMGQFRQEGVVLHYRYKDKNGDFLLEIVTSPKDFPPVQP